VTVETAYLTPVPVGSRVPVGFESGSVDPGNGGYLVAAWVTIKREGGGKAPCAADTVSLVP
jgi:hypothetical protein